MAFWNKKTHDDPIAEAIALTPLPFGGRSVTAREVRSKKWIDQSYLWELVRGHLEVEEVEWATGTGRTDEGRSQFYVTTHRLLGIPLAKTGRFTTRTGAVPFATVATVQVEPQGREIVVQIISSTNRDLETATPDEIFRDSFAFDARTDEQKAFVGALLVAETAHGGLFGDRALTPAYDSLVPQAVKEWLQSRAQFRSLG